MGRKRNHIVVVHLNDDELHMLNAKQSETGDCRETFIRKVISEAEVRQSPPAEYGKILWEIRRIGTNLNQLINIARAHGFVDERELKKIQNDVRSMDALFRKVFCGK